MKCAKNLKTLVIFHSYYLFFDLFLEREELLIKDVRQVNRVEKVGIYLHSLAKKSIFSFFHIKVHL
jgi:hypothetical protein